MVKLIQGVGVKDSGEFKLRHMRSKTKEYQAWSNMLARCYSKNYKERNKSYLGCYVCDDWIYFQKFARWYKDNYPTDGNSYQLDKDLIIPGNKIYSPDTCVFVSQSVNKFTTDSAMTRGIYMIGVNFDKSRGKFLAKCKNPISRKTENLGRFLDQLDAHKAWRKRKSELAFELSKTQKNPKVSKALLNYKRDIDNFKIYTDGFKL